MYKDVRNIELPILMVACRDMTSGDRGCSCVTSSLLRSCSMSPFRDILLLLKMIHFNRGKSENSKLQGEEKRPS